jgi:hypothetical protein
MRSCSVGQRDDSSLQQRRSPRGGAPLPAVVPASTTAVLTDQISRFLAEVVAELEASMPPEHGPGRPRLLASLCLWGGVLVQTLTGGGSQRALWRRLTTRGLWHFPALALSDQAVYRRLDREAQQPGPTPLARLFARVTAVLAPRLAPFADATLAPFASDVVALDETTLDQVQRWLPDLRGTPAGASALLPGKLGGVFDLRRQQWRTIEYVAAVQQHCSQAAPSLVEALARGTLVVADLGYFGFRWFDALTQRGLWWVSRLQRQTRYTVAHVHYQAGDTFDGLVWLGGRPRNQAGSLVRLVTFAHGDTVYRYLTNVRDPALLPLHEVARLYQRRWDIELAFLLVKQQLGLAMLWSAKPYLALQQAWAVLTIAQIVQALRLEIAGRAGVEVYDVSLALLVADAPQYAADGLDPVAVFVAEGRRLGYIRPSRRGQNHAPHLAPALLQLPPSDLCTSRAAHYRSPPFADGFVPSANTPD